MSKKNPSDFYVFNTQTSTTAVSRGKNPGRNWQMMDLAANPEYAQMLEFTKKGILAKEKAETAVPPHLRGKATSFHSMEHMTEEVIVYKTDVDGFVWVPKEKPEDAMKVYKSLKHIDPDVSFSHFGLQEEDLAKALEKPKADLTKAK